MPLDSKAAAVQPFAEERLAEPDYANHPAYGSLVASVTVLARIRALSRLIPWMFLILGKRCLWVDRLPRGLSLACRHLLLRVRDGAFTPATDALGRELQAKGVAVGCLPVQDIEALRQETAGLFAVLSEEKGAAARVFEDCQKWLTRGAHSAVYDRIEDSLRRCGATAAASAHLGRGASVLRVLLQVNDADDRFFLLNSFADAGMEEPATKGMHWDTNYGIVKCMIYMSEVTDKNGPFCFIPGSHRSCPGGFEGLVRRAVDRSGLSKLDPACRCLFMALPSMLRKKCSFGSDYLEGSETSERLLACEYAWTSRDGNFAVFDPLGIHRGGAVNEGQRRAIFAILG